MAIASEKCACDHERWQHDSYLPGVIGPYCTVKKCSCCKFTIPLAGPAGTVKEALTSALGLVKDRGWKTGSNYDGSGPIDADSAVFIGSGYNRMLYLATLERCFSLTGLALHTWNEVAGRTQQDVISLFELTLQEVT